jgi:hypothetical protein
MSDHVFDTGPIRTRIVDQPHEGRVYVERTQPTEIAVLERNAALRNTEIRDLSFGRYVAEIPEIALPDLMRDYPGIFNGPPAVRQRMLMKALRDHPEWMVQDKRRVFANA